MTYVVLTGEVHVGKTTICRAVVDLARQRGYRVRGFLTLPIFDRAGQRLGFTLLNLANAEQRELARVERCYGGPTVGPFHFDPAVLQWGYDIVAEAVAEGCDLLVMDEVGRLELEQDTGFAPALDLLVGDVVPRGLLVVRSALLDAFRRRVLHLEYVTFEVTIHNREAAPVQVAQWLLLT